MKFITVILLYLVSVFLTVPVSALADDLVLSVHPFVQAKEIEKKFTPLAEYLGRQLGVNISVKVGASYDEHIQAIGKNRVDLAYMGPVSYVTLVEDYGKKPLLSRIETDGQPTFQGYIVTRKDSEIKTLAELKGKSFAFGDPNSTMSYVVPHYMLVQAGVYDRDENTHEFLGTHENVALGVLSGDYDAGAIKPAVYRKFVDQGLRILAETPEISEHLFVTRSDLPQETIDVLRRAMFAASQSEQGMAALKAIKKSVTGLTDVKDADYDNLRIILNSRKEKH